MFYSAIYYNLTTRHNLNNFKTLHLDSLYEILQSSFFLQSVTCIFVNNNGKA